MQLAVIEEQLADGGEALELQVVGSLDLASTQAVLDIATSALRTSKALYLNAAGVDFIDSTGIGVLVAIARRGENMRTPFAVVERSTALQRVLDRLGLTSEWQPPEHAWAASPDCRDREPMAQAALV